MCIRDRGVATKVGTGLESAISLGTGKARKLIREGARKAAKKVRKGEPQPVRLEPPYEWEVRVLPGAEPSLAGYLRRNGATQIDERTVVIRTDDARAVLR